MSDTERPIYQSPKLSVFGGMAQLTATSSMKTDTENKGATISANAGKNRPTM